MAVPVPGERAGGAKVVVRRKMAMMKETAGEGTSMHHLQEAAHLEVRLHVALRRRKVQRRWQRSIRRLVHHMGPVLK